MNSWIGEEVADVYDLLHYVVNFVFNLDFYNEFEDDSPTISSEAKIV